MRFQFADPGYFMLLLLPVWLVWQQYRSVALPFSDIRRLQTSVVSWRLRLRAWLVWMQALALVLVVAALARPQRVVAERLQMNVRSDIVFVLDVSNSMKALDLKPDRLGAAKQLIRDVAAERPFSRFGLVLFAQQAYIQVPPTRDHAVLLKTLDQVHPAAKMGIEDGTSLGLGIATAAGLLVDSPTPQKVIVVLTDGVSTDETVAPLDAAEAAAQFGIQIFAVGVGQEGLVPFPQEGLSGRYEVFWESLLDEDVLREVSHVTNGDYFRAENGRSRQQIPAALTTPSPQRIESVVQVQTQELFAVLLWMGVVLLMLEMWLRRFVLRVVV